MVTYKHKWLVYSLLIILIFTVCYPLAMKLINSNTKPLSVDTYIRLFIFLLTITFIIIRHKLVVLFIRLTSIVFLYRSIIGLTDYYRDDQLFERILFIILAFTSIALLFYAQKIVKVDKIENNINGAT